MRQASLQAARMQNPTLGVEQIYGILERADGKMLLHSQPSGVTYVGNPIFAFLAVASSWVALGAGVSFAVGIDVLSVLGDDVGMGVIG